MRRIWEQTFAKLKRLPAARVIVSKSILARSCLSLISGWIPVSSWILCFHDFALSALSVSATSLLLQSNPFCWLPLSQAAPLLLSLEERTDQVRCVFLKIDKGDSERGHNAPGGRSRDFYRESKGVTRATSFPSVDRSLMTLTLPAALAGWNDGQGWRNIWNLVVQ